LKFGNEPKKELDVMVGDVILSISICNAVSTFASAKESD
jgi:hypothetical protein